ncbi:MAG: lipopolysaccharide biosynthesis protein [Chitinispirillia bacterium]|nr:lipopolysaccharide biosynthesis protein [Chitinispirillia bacterium]MCL2240915.1 lipopolysaccharide biosynthesis protein [Chitinispirillia bacterium]
MDCPPEENTGNLRTRTVTGIMWTLAEMFGRYGVTYAVTIYLARLLSPKDYGLVGLITALFAITAVIIEGGFRAALIRKKEVSQAGYNAVWLMSLALALAMYAALYFLAPHIARFYGEPQLTALTRLLGIILITNAASIVQNTKLRRDMKFNRLALITIPAEILSGTTAIWMAYNGFGVMSLAAKIIIASVTAMILYRCVVRWRPTLELRAEPFKEFFKAGASLSAVMMLGAIYKNVNALLIGKVFSMQTLGYYSFTEKVINLTSNSVTSAVEQVTITSFSKIQDDNARLQSGQRQAVQGAAAIIFPLMTALAMLAEPLIILLLNDSWLPAVPYLRILCLTSAISPLCTIPNGVLMVKNLSLRLKIDSAAMLTMIAMAFALVPLGIEVFLIGQTAHMLVLAAVIDYFKSRCLNCRFGTVFGYAAPVALSAAAMGAVLYFAMKLFNGAGLAQCAVAATAGLAVYCLCLRIFKVEVFMRLLKIQTKPVP